MPLSQSASGHAPFDDTLADGSPGPLVSAFATVSVANSSSCSSRKEGAQSRKKINQTECVVISPDS